MVRVGGADQTSGTLLASVGAEVRGLQDTPSVPPFGLYAGRPMYQITIYAEAGGETISFSLSEGSRSASITETLTFEVNGNVGSVVAPCSL